jgi:hypothetical protein
VATPSPGTATSAATSGDPHQAVPSGAIASDRIEAEMTYDMKVVSPDVGFFFNGAAGLEEQ